MPLINRSELPAFLQQVKKGSYPQLYLFFGERYLCREAADSLQQALLALPAGGSVNSIDGDREDSSRTLGQIMNFSLLPGLQIHRVTDSRLFHSKNTASALWNKVALAHAEKKEARCCRHLLAFIALAGLSANDGLEGIEAGQWQNLFGFSRPQESLVWADELLAAAGPQQVVSGGDITGRYRDAFTKGVPPYNILLLTAEAVDKRKQFFTFIKKEGVVVDCSIDTGSGAAAQKGQKAILQELVLKSLGGLGKKMGPRVLDIFFERVGFHPVAVVMETEKLALSVGDRELITVEDLDAMVGRTREDALFELTDAFGQQQTGRTLVILHRLLENGIHGLAILATLRNYLRRLLIFRSLQLQPEPQWQSGMNAQQFQGSYLPALKQRGEWKELLQGHPYALFMSFSKAQGFSCAQLKNWFGLLLQAEYRLKGAPLPQELVLEELLLSMFATAKRNRREISKRQGY
ncbi:MAG: DNA polymerase III subunit delta [Proteobacteria bacterium]|nr:DNA polymerase III subunit delta [Pseudomonadota bacterium]MBU1058583.1 DNA polymerase III subunit delta [Pseudomonadota bacterium]